MNAPTRLLMSIASGDIPLRYRGVIQGLVTQKGASLLRAAFYAELLQNPELYPRPVETAMKILNASRATIFRDYKTHKNIFEVNK